MNRDDNREITEAYKNFFATEDFAIRLDVAPGKYTDDGFIELLKKFYKTKLNDRCFGRKRWKSWSEKDVITLHWFKQGTEIRKNALKGFYNSKNHKRGYRRTIDSELTNQDIVFDKSTGEISTNVTSRRNGSSFELTDDGKYNRRLSEGKFILDSDGLTIHKKTRFKHKDTEKHFHILVRLPDSIDNCIYSKTDYSDEYDSLVSLHIRDITNEYNAKYKSSLDVMITKSSSLTFEGKHYGQRELQFNDTFLKEDRYGSV